MTRKFLYEFQPGIEADKNCIADEHYLPTFFSVSICFLNSHTPSLLDAETFLFVCWIFFSDDWSYGDLELVSDLCWLVWTTVASKDSHGKWDITRVHEKRHGMFRKHNLLKVVMISFLLSSFLACQTEEMSTHVTSVGEVCSLADLSFVVFTSLFSFFIILDLWFWSMEMSCIGHVHGTGLDGLVICLRGSFILILSTHWSTSSLTTQAQLSEGRILEPKQAILEFIFVPDMLDLLDIVNFPKNKNWNDSWKLMFLDGPEELVYTKLEQKFFG